MSNRKRRERRRKEQAARQAQAAPLQPGSTSEIEWRRQVRDLRAEVRILKAELDTLDPDSWPPRYRELIRRLTVTLLELEEAADPIKGRILQPAGRSGVTDSLRDEGASTRTARHMANRIVREVNAVLDFNPSIDGKRCRRSVNQCPMSGKVQMPRYADHPAQSFRRPSRR